AVDGVATFSDLTLTTPSQLTLDVRSTGLASTYTGVTVSAAAATHYRVTSYSGPVLTGSTFTAVVYAEDQYDNIDPNYNGSVTLALAANPGGATLGGPLTGQVSRGVATFSKLTLDKPGTGYALQVLGGLTSGTSPAFNEQNRLVVTTQPPGSVTA